MKRRAFLNISATAAIGFCSMPFAAFSKAGIDLSSVQESLRADILKEAAVAYSSDIITITAFPASASTGGIHDFYSEGDYWWPNPADAKAPYIQRDGMTNPDNFVAHREAMIDFSQQVGIMASAYLLTQEQRYLHRITQHLEAWFVAEKTKMNPHLLYAQAIQGLHTGRGIGIIDTIHFMEVAQSIYRLQDKINPEVVKASKSWFSEYLNWLMTHPYGQDEMRAKNNHGTCFVMQVASFAKLVGDTELLSFCRRQFTEVLMPNQMAADGSFPLELKRTKAYGYSIFNLDAMATLCQILSSPKDNLWEFKLADGRSMYRAVAFLKPYIRDKNKWPLEPDVMYWEDWPVAQPFLLFAAFAYQDRPCFTLWRGLEHFPKTPEVIRNLPIKNPLLWLS